MPPESSWIFERGEALEADELDVKAGDFAALGVGEIGLELEAEHHVADDIQPREKGRLLEHHHAVAARLGDALAIGEDLAGIGLLEAGDDVEQGGFSAAAGADEADELALADA